MANENNQDRMLKWFEWGNLKPEFQDNVSVNFESLAQHIIQLCEPGPERTVALRKLLEAKDAAVRAKIYPVG